MPNQWVQRSVQLIELSCVSQLSNYEEVGHGAAAGTPADVHEMVTVDMVALVGTTNWIIAYLLSDQ